MISPFIKLFCFHKKKNFSIGNFANININHIVAIVEKFDNINNILYTEVLLNNQFLECRESLDEIMDQIQLYYKKVQK